MSDSQTAWTILWDRAVEGPSPEAPFEIGEVSPTLAGALNVPEGDARRIISGLLTELDRMPDGERFFTRAGDAVVPLPEFSNARKSSRPALNTYPYEL